LLLQVWGKLVEALADVGYDSNNLVRNWGREAVWQR
jgi:hypothetical protein